MSVSMSLNCHGDTRYEKLTSAPTTAHIEWTGILSTDDARAECDTNREWIKVSWVYSCLHLLVKLRYHDDACPLGILFTGKMLDATEKALGLPQLSGDEAAWKCVVS